MTTNTLVIANMILLIIGIIIIIRYNKVRREKFLEMIIAQINLDNMSLVDCFSKDALAVYMDIINNPNGWSLHNCTLDKISDGTKIWAANELDSRRFYANSMSDEEKKLIEAKNAKLTHYDKVLFDKIVKAYKDRQDKLVTKFFI